MRTIYTIIIALFMVCNAYSQVYYEKDFNSDPTQQAPSGMRVIDRDGNTNYYSFMRAAWVVFQDANIGVASNAAVTSSRYNPAGTSDDWMITPKISIGDNAAIVWDALNFSPTSPEGYRVLISTTGDNWTDFTKVVFSILAESSTWISRSVNLAAEGYANQDIYIAFHNNTARGNALFIDNLKVFTPEFSYDAGVIAMTLQDYYPLENAPFNITGTIQNFGSETITSFDLNYTVNDGSVTTTQITGENIGFYQTYDFSIPDWTPTKSGSKTVKVWASNINGNSDEDPSNDAFSQQTLIYTQADVYSRKPLLEVFTSSTCGPCRPGNENMKRITDVNPGEYVEIKYQMTWPGAGDPYFNADGVTRRGYYSVNSIPRMEIDGGWDANAQLFTQALLDQYQSVPSFVDIDLQYEINGRQVDVAATVNSKADFTNSDNRLFIAVLERHTTRNVRTNGETDFYNIEQKMIPDGNGYTLGALTACSSVEYTQSYTFPSSFRNVEEYTDLYVIAWVQNYSTKEVYNATIGEEGIKPPVLLEYDASVASIDIVDELNIIDGPFDITGSMTNLGAATITSMNINYSIDGGAAISARITGLNIATDESYEYTHPDPWTPADRGLYEIEVWASNINGFDDEKTCNDAQTTTVTILKSFEYDASVTGIDLDDELDLDNGPFDITCSLTNLGATTITYVNLNYSINGGSAVQASMTGLNIPTGQTFDCTHSIPWAPEGAGTFEIKVWASDINGNDDEKTGNDAKTTTVTILKAFDYDAGVTSVDFGGVKKWQDAPFDISGSLTNFGKQTITELDINYSIDGSDPVTAALTDLNIAQLETYTFTHPEQWMPIENGSTKIKVWVSNINGQPDENLANDTTGVTVLIIGDRVDVPMSLTANDIGKIFPNPAGDAAVVPYNLENSANVRIQLIDMAGQLVYSIDEGTKLEGLHTSEIDVTSLAAGNYMLKLQIGESVFSEKLVIKR